MTIGSTSSAELVSFVPRLTIEWLRDHPDDLSREVDGTVAFIDISGFTAMSEKLSSQGRAGAEEVTEVMNATFAALLAVAYGQGGGLLKFGGDALLLLYEGDDHAARAARAAFEMRRTLRAIGRPRTSAGAVQLKMHAGLHSRALASPVAPSAASSIRVWTLRRPQMSCAIESSGSCV